MKSVHADLVYTGRTILKDKYLNFSSTAIQGLADQPAGEVVGRFAVLTPALIDPHSHIGLIRAGEPAAEQEANEKLDLILSLPDVLDSVQMDDTAFMDSMVQGVLYSCVLPGSLNLISGRSAVIRHWAPDTNSALLARAGIKGALGFNPISGKNGPAKRPTTRMGSLALLRSKLEEVKRKTVRIEKGDKKAELSAEEEVLADILAGRKRFRVHVHKVDDVAALLRLKDEYGFELGVEHVGGVPRKETFEELKRRDIPVIYGPLDGFAYKVELKHRSWKNVEYLMDSGVRFGLMTDHPVTPSGSLLLQTRWLLRFGLSKARAMGVVCLNNAEILGLGERLGSLEKDKLASFVGWDGDPFDLASKPLAAYGEGERIY